jgi:hypothetical protein
MFVLWYKKDVFKRLIKELAEIWPMPPMDEKALLIKNKTLIGLRLVHRCKYPVIIY